MINTFGRVCCDSVDVYCLSVGASTELTVCTAVGVIAGVFGLVICVILAIIIAYLW